MALDPPARPPDGGGMCAALPHVAHVWARMKRKSAMAFPHRSTDRSNDRLIDRQAEFQSDRPNDPFHPAAHERQHGEQGQPSTRVVAGGSAASPSLWVASPTPRCHLQSGSQIEGEHQLEKLEFALAVALTRGDQGRSRQLRDQIEALGGNREEPGT